MPYNSNYNIRITINNKFKYYKDLTKQKSITNCHHFKVLENLYI